MTNPNTNAAATNGPTAQTTQSATWTTPAPTLQEAPAELGLAMVPAFETFKRGADAVSLARLPQTLAFARKPSTLKEVRAQTLPNRSASPEPVYAFGMVVLTAAQFDDLAGSLLRDRDWLGRLWEDAWRKVLTYQQAEGYGRLCILVTAEARPVLAIDTQGSTYARYVAMIPELIYRPQPEPDEDWSDLLPPSAVTWENSPASVRALVERIAIQRLHFETIEERRSDRLDFHEVSVVSVRDALLYAYTLGMADGSAIFGA